MILGLSGRQGSGKDTAAQHLVAKHNWRRIAFADAMRVSLYRLNPYLETVEMRLQDALFAFENWDILKRELPEVRRLLQTFGTEVGRDVFGESIWIDIAMRAVDSAPESNWVITDVRFENEVQAIRQRGGHLIYIRRPGCKANKAHRSERFDTRAVADIEVVNNLDIENLQQCIECSVACLAEHNNTSHSSDHE
jgi:ABC-type dipeptide/oligopeptide/nickel transport system ATPase subunit